MDNSSQNSFQLHSASCITNIQQPALPSRYFSAKPAIHFRLHWKKKIKGMHSLPPRPTPAPPQPAGKQPNHFNYIPNGCNLHIATSQCCVSENFHNRLDFLWANKIFLISRKRPNRKERGAVQLREVRKLSSSLIRIRKIVNNEDYKHTDYLFRQSWGLMLKMTWSKILSRKNT